MLTRQQIVQWIGQDKRHIIIQENQITGYNLEDSGGGSSELMAMEVSE